MNQHLAQILVGLAACTVATSCDDPLGPQSNPSFLAVPDTVVAGGTVRVTYTLRNDMLYPVTIRSSQGCLFHLETFLGKDRVPWQGTDYDCAQMVTDFTVLPRDSLHVVHVLVAAEAGAPAGTVLPGATYRIRARMNTRSPDLEAEVTVKL